MTLLTGTIRSLNDRKFGFIELDDHKAYFFHWSALTGTTWDALHVGGSVRFEPTDSPKGLRAERVQLATNVTTPN